MLKSSVRFFLRRLDLNIKSCPFQNINTGYEIKTKVFAPFLCDCSSASLDFSSSSLLLMLSPPRWVVAPMCSEKMMEFPFSSSNLFLNTDSNLSQTTLAPCLSEFGSSTVKRFPDRAGISDERRVAFNAAEKIMSAAWLASAVKVMGVTSIWIKVCGHGYRRDRETS